MKFLLSILIGTSLLKDSWQASKIKIEPSVQPSFITQSQVFKVKDQDTVVLPCEVANSGPYVLVWKKGIAVLSAGKTLVSPDSRVTLNPDYSLEIKEVGPQDAGDYVCQIGTLKPKEITHTVEILVPPRIHHVSSNGRVEVKKGSTVHLECKSSGNPVPKVTWSRKNNVMPGGEQSVITQVLTFDKVDRHHAGMYECLASNGVGNDVKDQIYLHVLYPPEITVERPVVYSGEGMEAQLVCVVHGENQPEVVWYKDTMQLDTTERHIMESRGSRHTLVIRKVKGDDFGNYSCVADNSMGKTRKSIQLTGNPRPVKFNSPATGKSRDNYNISWEVESLSPIHEYKLLYRKIPTGNSVTSDSQPQPLSSYYNVQGSKRTNQRGENRNSSTYGGYVYTRPMKDRREWRDVILPAVPAQPVGMQFMSYLIRGLEPGQQYEVKVQARNRFGWTLEDPSFTFKTTDTEESTTDNRHLFAENAIEDVMRSVRSRNSASNCQFIDPLLSFLSILLTFVIYF